MSTSNKRTRITFIYDLGQNKVPFGITHAEISGHINRIEESAFRSRRDLIEVTFPESVNEIGEKVIEVTFPVPLTEIGICAFEECTSLPQIHLSKTLVTNIGYKAFKDCKSLAEVTFPHTLTQIGYWSFSGCTSLVKVDLSKTSGTLRLLVGTFLNCRSLTTLIFPPSLTGIGNDCFRDCRSLRVVDLSKCSLTEIERNTFRSCIDLQYVYLPETLISIHNYAFEDCFCLSNISFPNVTKIGYRVFNVCSALPVVDLSKSSITEIKENTFTSCTSLEYVHLPETLKTIEDLAFRDCTSLQIIAIPDDVNIEGDSFRGCTLIDRVKEQLQAISDPTADRYEFLQYQRRFANLPLHQVCYDPNVTLETLTACIALATTNNSIDHADTFSMNALHILCMNPNVTPCMVSMIVASCQSLRTMRSIEDMTPLMMFLRFKCLLPYDNDGNVNTNVDRVSLCHCLFEGQADWDVVGLLLELDEEMKREITIANEETGLYPFMEVAINQSNGTLKTLYNLLYYSVPELLSRI